MKVYAKLTTSRTTNNEKIIPPNNVKHSNKVTQKLRVTPLS